MSAETHEDVHRHPAPTGFIRKYIFSIDHKVIGIQYIMLALVAVLVGMVMSLLMRMNLSWPGTSWPILETLFPSGAPGGVMTPEFYLSLVTMHGTIMVFFVAQGLGDRRKTAAAYFQASLVVERTGRWLLSRTYAEKAKALYEELEDERNVGRLLNNLGGLNLLLGKPQDAIAQLKASFAVAVEADSQAEAGQAMNGLAPSTSSSASGTRPSSTSARRCACSTVARTFSTRSARRTSCSVAP